MRRRLFISIWIAAAMAVCSPAAAVMAEHKPRLIEEDLIVLPPKPYDVQEAQAMIGRIEQIPQHLLVGLMNSDVHIKLINGRLTDDPDFSRLKGTIPRGWQRTWDDIPGIGGNPVGVRIGYSATGKGHGSANLELHETFHAIDGYVFDHISQSQAFMKLWRAESAHLFHNDRYMTVYPEEYFAEVSCRLYYNAKTRAEVAIKAPLTYAYLNRLFTE